MVFEYQLHLECGDELGEVFSNGVLTRYGNVRLPNPVIKALGALERDSCCLCMVYHYFRELKYYAIYKRESGYTNAGCPRSNMLPLKDTKVRNCAGRIFDEPFEPIGPF
ncbi:Hypothetical protein PHPALM_3368 [Phytophthora palmivora]|uniref:Uncharacterized protein n=1 Tax=Phytophthora palmivora TaxID=4796 RepID=A0A2P4YMK5_9STRA|nr:Hypothetical protein PHPALM_3368 [Phytophthora palmivora]